MGTKSEGTLGHLEWILTVYRLIDNSVYIELNYYPPLPDVLCKLSNWWINREQAQGRSSYCSPHSCQCLIAEFC